MLKLNCKKESYGNLNFIRLLLVKKIGGKLFEYATMYLNLIGQFKDRLLTSKIFIITF